MTEQFRNLTLSKGMWCAILFDDFLSYLCAIKIDIKVRINIDGFYTHLNKIWNYWNFQRVKNSINFHSSHSLKYLYLGKEETSLYSFQIYLRKLCKRKHWSFYPITKKSLLAIRRELMFCEENIHPEHSEKGKKKISPIPFKHKKEIW